jgi:3-methyladenine DNA glycosylase AlkD
LAVFRRPGRLFALNMIKQGLSQARRELRRHASAKKAKNLRWFFKTGPGEYAEGDVFIGVRVPEIRRVARRFDFLGLRDVFGLIKSGIHEERLLGLLILVSRFSQKDDEGRGRIFKMYLRHASYVNNWDLVDLSAPHIVGAYLKERSRQALYSLARSKLLWERRISIVATYSFIRDNDFQDTLALSRLLLGDGHDLIHKATGWMLREVGKRDIKSLKAFLKKFSEKMPRTMLRYAIEKFPETERRAYLRRRTNPREDLI